MYEYDIGYIGCGLESFQYLSISLVYLNELSHNLVNLSVQYRLLVERTLKSACMITARERITVLVTTMKHKLCGRCLATSLM